MDFPNISTAFPEGVPATLPTDQAGVLAFGERLRIAMQGIRDAINIYGPRGQAAHNAFMLNGLMALGYENATYGYLWQPVYEAINPIWQEIYELHRNSPYGSSEGMLPPALALDPLEIPVVAAYWPNVGWLTETQAATAAPLQPLPVPQTVTPTQTQTPVDQSLATGPANDTILGFPLWQIGIAAVAVLLLINMK